MVARIVIGKFPDGDTGVRVSQAGYSALSNPIDNERMIFNSSWPGALSVHTQSTSAITISKNASLSISFPDLGFLPIFYIAIKGNTASSWTSYQNSSFYDYTNYNQYYDYFAITVFSSHIDFYYRAGSITSYGPSSFNVLYLITANRATS
jgi:hypothetical protein